MTQVQLERPGRENSCGDDVIIPCGSVKRHPQEHADPETGGHVTNTVKELNSQKFMKTLLPGHVPVWSQVSRVSITKRNILSVYEITSTEQMIIL